MVRQGEDQANALRQQGQAAAQTWNAVGQGIQNTVSGVIKAKQEAPLIAAEQSKAKDVTRTAAGQQVVARALQGPEGPTPDGTSLPSPFLKQEGDVAVWDIPKLTSYLAEQGYGDKAEVLLSGAQKMNDAHRQEAQFAIKARQAKDDLFAEAAGNVAQLMKLGMPVKVAIETVSPSLIANDKTLTPQIAQLSDQLSGIPPEQALGVLRTIMDRGSKAPMKLTKDEKAYSAYEPDRVLGDNTVPDKPTAESTSVDAYIGSLNKPKGTQWSSLTGSEQAAFPKWKEQITARPANSQEATFDLPGIGAGLKGDYIPGMNGQPGHYFYKGEDVTGKVKQPPPASVQVQNLTNAQWTDDQIDFYARQVKDDAAKMNLVSGLDKTVRSRIERRIADLGGNVNKLSQASRTMREMATEVLPHIDRIQAEADELNKLGLLGPIASRYREFIAGKIGAGEFAGGNAETAKLIGKFRVDAGLLTTAVMKAHIGARGSSGLLDHFSDLLGAEKADISTFTGELSGFKDWMKGYSQMGGDATTKSAAAGRIRVKGPNGETGTVPDDGKALPAGWSKAQ